MACPTLDELDAEQRQMVQMMRSRVQKEWPKRHDLWFKRWDEFQDGYGWIPGRDGDGDGWYRIAFHHELTVRPKAGNHWFWEIILNMVLIQASELI